MTPPGGRSAADRLHQPRECAALLDAEDRHFWFTSRNAVIAAVLERLVAPMATGYRVLEAGSGSGNVLRFVERVCTGGRVVGCELFEEGLAHARKRVGCPLVQADVRALPFAGGFQLIGLFDVLEHLPDDRAVLTELRRQLAPNGYLVMTVPAHAALWSYADDYAGHYRRYSRESLQTALLDSGFRVKQLTYFMAPLLPLMWLRRRAGAGPRPRVDRPTQGEVSNADETSRRQQSLAELTVVPGLNALLAWMLAMEAPLVARGGRLPVGTSLLAVASCGDEGQVPSVGAVDRP